MGKKTASNEPWVMTSKLSIPVFSFAFYVVEFRVCFFGKFVVVVVVVVVVIVVEHLTKIVSDLY